MRKVILIAILATMSSTASYANLSLASNDAAAEASAQPSGQALEARAEAPVAAVKAAPVSRPRQRYHSERTFVTQRSYYGHCQ